jgi:hypothetical protein
MAGERRRAPARTSFVARTGVASRACGTLLAFGLCSAAPASASPATLQRAVENIVFAPADMALSPVVATHAVYHNLREVEDPTAVRVAFVIPGIVWNTGVQSMAAVVREIAGLLELVPGLGLFFLRTDLEPLFDIPLHSPALIDVETRAVHVKIGVDYTASL